MNTQHRQILQDYRQSGVSLLEVLISIVVLTVGLLGTAHMQTTGLVNNQRAYQRSQATLLAYDIADRMRANSASINNYLTSYMELEDAEAQENCKSTESCTSANMAENDQSTDFFRGDANKSQPLPNLGFWYNYSPARKWLLQGRVDWISAEIGDYDGTLWNTTLGVNYQAFRHVGFSLSYQYFNLNLNVNSSDWKGGIDLRYRGPVLAVTGNW